MDVFELPEDDIISQIDLDNFFDDLPDDLSVLGADVFNTPSRDAKHLSVDEIEDLLMKDDDNGVIELEAGTEVPESFFADLLVDSPSDGGSAEVVDVSSDKDSDSSDGRSSNVDDKQVDAAEAVDDGKNSDDPTDKKRQRQLRNRDAALRSRERKKSYVKDLEMKSKYLERECLRLGRLLQCLAAENHALRFSLHSSSAYSASMAKHESAVLLLESLLLGSLLWFMGIICLSTTIALLQLTLGAESAEKKGRETQAPKGARNETHGSNLSASLFINGRRCRASKTKMKSELFVLEAPTLFSCCWCPYNVF